MLCIVWLVMCVYNGTMGETITMRKLGSTSTTRAMKKRCESDLLFLARDILGYKYNNETREGINDPPDIVHQRMVLLDNREERWHMSLYPRFTYKTTLLTICKSIQLLLNDPNTTILIVSEIWENSRRMLNEIVWHLTNNEVLLELYGEFKPKKGRGWCSEYINISQKTSPRKEPSIATAGIDT